MERQFSSGCGHVRALLLPSAFAKLTSVPSTGPQGRHQETHLSWGPRLHQPTLRKGPGGLSALDLHLTSHRPLPQELRSPQGQGINITAPPASGCQQMLSTLPAKLTYNWTISCHPHRNRFGPATAISHLDYCKSSNWSHVYTCSLLSILKVSSEHSSAQTLPWSFERPRRPDVTWLCLF